MLPFGFTPSGRFPRAWPQLRKEPHFSDLRTHAFPAGVATLRSSELIWRINTKSKISEQDHNYYTEQSKYIETPTGGKA